MLALVSGTRDENYQPFPPEHAAAYANTIHQSLKDKGCCCPVDGKKINAIFATINYVQFNSINEYYRGNRLAADISEYCGGDHETLLLTLGKAKYVILSEQVNKALTSGLTVDKETLSRILGSLCKFQCVTLREYYNKQYPDLPLEAAFDKYLSSVYKDACMHLIMSADCRKTGSNPEHATPMGTNNEDQDDQYEIRTIGSDALKTIMDAYSDAVYSSRAQADHVKNKTPVPDQTIPDWDGAGVSMDATALTSMLSKYNATNNGLMGDNAKLHEDNLGLKNSVFELTKQVAEMNGWMDITTTNQTSLKKHIAKRDALDIRKYASSVGTVFKDTSVMDILTSVICERSRGQISDANAAFFLMYNEEMASYIKSCLGGTDFSKFLYYIIKSSCKVGPNADYSIQYEGSYTLDVEFIEDAIKSWSSWLTNSSGVDDSVLLEILFCRTNAEMKMLKVCYADKHKVTLEEDIGKEVGQSSYNLLFQGCMLGQRDENPQSMADMNRAQYLANAIFAQGIKTIWDGGVGSSVCRELMDNLSKASDNQLQAVDQIFKQLNVGNAKDLSDEMYASLDRPVARAMTGKFLNKYVFLAKCIFESLDNKLVTDRTSIVRILGRASKEEIALISAAYHERYQQGLVVALNQAIGTVTPNLMRSLRAFIFEVWYDKCMTLCLTLLPAIRVNFL